MHRTSTTVLLAGVGVLAPTLQQVAIADFLMWVEGGPPVWSDVVSWVGGGDANLPTGSLVIRLIDPDAAGSAGTDWDLSAGIATPAINCIKQLRDGGFTGDISMVPYFGDGAWSWNPGVPVTNSWEVPFRWVEQANVILAANNVSPGIVAVMLEGENSTGIVTIDDATLQIMQTFQHTAWPPGPSNPDYVAMSAIKAWSAGLNMIRWTTTTDSGTPGSPFSEIPLREGALMLYNMYKSCDDSSGGYVTFNDSYSASATVNFPMPARPDSIYTLAAVAADPVSTILGTPTVACPSDTTVSSDFGFLMGNKSSDWNGGDLSKVTMLFSLEDELGPKGGLIRAFGSWDGGGGAGIREFQQFLTAFDAAFLGFWFPDGTPPAAQRPGYGFFGSEYVPGSWWVSSNDLPCNADLSDNGAVEIADVNLLIAGWGTASGDVTGDDLTTMDDLLLVLMSWGACP